MSPACVGSTKLKGWTRTEQHVKVVRRGETYRENGSALEKCGALGASSGSATVGKSNRSRGLTARDTQRSTVVSHADLLLSHIESFCARERGRVKEKERERIAKVRASDSRGNKSRLKSLRERAKEIENDGRSILSDRSVSGGEKARESEINGQALIVGHLWRPLNKDLAKCPKR